MELRTHHRIPPPLLHLRRSRYRLPRNPSRGRQDPHGPRELTFFHTLTDVPVDEGTLGVHKIELVIATGEDLRDSGRVGDHAHGTHNLGQVTTRHNGGRLVVDTALETGGGPVDELDGTLGLDGSDGRVDVL